MTDFSPTQPIAEIAQARALAWQLVTVASLADRVELREENQPIALSVSGPDGFGFFGSTAWRTVRVVLPTTPRAVAVAVARFVLGEFWAEDHEITAMHAQLPLAFALALVSAEGA
ncbi:MAG: hypothetical protein Q8Q09_20315 [Deltaproteobacteria bacterium]|nr:hypothetical protein [Deltaproteobacteria bacterium]